MSNKDLAASKQSEKDLLRPLSLAKVIVDYWKLNRVVFWMNQSRISHTLYLFEKSLLVSAS